MAKLFILSLCVYLAWARAQVKTPEKLQTAVTPDTPVFNTDNVYFVFSGSNLPSKDTNGGVADPFIKVYFGSIPSDVKKDGKELDEIGASETINDESNPSWTKVFKVQYSKGTNQKVFVEVRDHDPLNPDDVIGTAYIDLDEYVSNGKVKTALLENSKSGSVTMKGTTPIYLSLQVKNVPALDEFGGLSDPFVKCYFRYGKEGKDVKFYETERVDNVENATWDGPIAFDNYQRGTNQFFHFKVRDHDAITGNDDIGEAFLEIDPFVEKRMPSIVSLGKTSNATLTINVTNRS